MLLQRCLSSGNLPLNAGTVAAVQRTVPEPVWVGIAPCTGAEDGWDGGRVQQGLGMVE